MSSSSSQLPLVAFDIFCSFCVVTSIVSSHKHILHNFNLNTLFLMFLLLTSCKCVTFSAYLFAQFSTHRVFFPVWFCQFSRRWQRFFREQKKRKNEINKIVEGLFDGFLVWSLFFMIFEKCFLFYLAHRSSAAQEHDRAEVMAEKDNRKCQMIGQTIEDLPLQIANSTLFSVDKKMKNRKASKGGKSAKQTDDGKCHRMRGEW